MNNISKHGQIVLAKNRIIFLAKKEDSKKAIQMQTYFRKNHVLTPEKQTRNFQRRVKKEMKDVD